MQKILVPLFVLLSVSCGFAQTRIKGVVTSPDQKPLAFANVLLFHAVDTTFLKGDIADDKGLFELHFGDPGSFFVRIESVGYEDFYTAPFDAGRDVDLGTLVIRESTEELSEVVVAAKKPPFEHKIDRTIVNVQNSITNVGNTALNVLSKSPSVIVDRATDQITLMGNQGVIVMIDNKQVRMESGDVMDLLQGMSADNIDNIEIITTPPASYDVEGNAGIININTIKSTNDGLTGRFNARAGYGVLPKYGASLNLSYSKEKLYFYGNLSTENDHTAERREDFSDLLYGPVNVVAEQKLKRDSYTGMHSGELGLDYDLTAQSMIGFSLKGQFRDWQMDARTEGDLKRNGEDSISQVTDSYEENRLLQLIGNVHFRHNFSDQSNLVLDYDYITFNRDNPSTYETTNETTEGVLTERDFISDGDTPLDIHVAKADYSHTFTERLSLETGLKTTLSSFENRVKVAYEENGSYENEPRFTDNFYMNEAIYAAYASVDWRVIPDLQIKTGLRYESYDMQLDSDNEGEILSRRRDNFFPTLYLNYKLAEENQLTFSYSRRIDRPGFLILAPAFYFFDPNTLLTGNPNIVPTRSTQYKLDYQLKSLSMSLQYMEAELPVYAFQTELDEQSQHLITLPLQGQNEKTLSFSASLPWEITDKWTSRYNVNAFHARQKPIIEGMVVNQTTSFFLFSTTHNFSLGNELELEVSGIYNSPIKYATLEVGARPSLDIGLQKKFKSGASLSLNVNDVLNTFSYWSITSDVPEAGIYFTREIDLEGPTFRLNFSMPLGNKQLKGRQRRETGSAEEQQRLN